MIVSDLRALTLESDRIGRIFTDRNHLGRNDFRALVDIIAAQEVGAPLTAGDLRDGLGLSGAAITYLVERMIASGHVTRETDPTDRRKVILRCTDHGREVARSFFTPLIAHHRGAMAALPEEDLAAAHRVLSTIIGAMREFSGDVSG